MNLIRNNGFERGSTQFWVMEALGSLEIDSVEHHRGSYSGKVTSTGAGTVSVRQVDYMSLTNIPLVKGEVWINAGVGKVIKTRIRYYDADLNFISGEYSSSIIGIGNWQVLEFNFRTPLTAVYGLLQVRYTSAGADEVFYIDDLYAALQDVNSLLMAVVTLADLSNLVASGDTSTTPKAMIGYRDHYAEIDVTSMTGTAPTCDVTICETDQYDNERVLGTFTQFNAITDQRIGIAAPIGKGMYVKYVMGGTVTDCDFKVSVIGVR